MDQLGLVEDAVVAENVLIGGQLQLGRIVRDRDDGLQFSGAIHDNLISRAGNFGLAFLGLDGEQITASVRGNLLRGSAQECVYFFGAATFAVDIIDNEFSGCGGKEFLRFEGGASLATGSFVERNIIRYLRPSLRETSRRGNSGHASAPTFA